MKSPAFRKSQRGELSLFWALVLFVALSLVLMFGLMSWGGERNLFAEYWDKAVAEWNAQTGGKPAKALGNAVGAIGNIGSGANASAPAPGSEVRRCTIKGKVVYSNVECGPDSAGSRKIDVTPTQGLGPAGGAPAAPKKPERHEQ
jgi:hypothetical protein